MEAAGWRAAVPRLPGDASPLPDAGLPDHLARGLAALPGPEQDAPPAADLVLPAEALAALLAALSRAERPEDVAAAALLAARRARRRARRRGRAAGAPRRAGARRRRATRAGRSRPVRGCRWTAGCRSPRRPAPAAPSCRAAARPGSPCRCTWPAGASAPCCSACTAGCPTSRSSPGCAGSPPPSGLPSGGPSARSAATTSSTVLEALLAPERAAGLAGCDVVVRTSPFGGRLGGDVVECVPDSGGGWLLVADVVGRGAQAAPVAHALRAAVQACAPGAYGPADVVRALERVVPHAVESLVTALVVRVDGDRALLCSAGHPPPLLVRGGAVEPVPVEPGLPLGTGLGSPGGPVVPLPLAGAVLVAWSDGLLDRDDEVDLPALLGRCRRRRPGRHRRRGARRVRRGRAGAGRPQPGAPARALTASASARPLVRRRRRLLLERHDRGGGARPTGSAGRTRSGTPCRARGRPRSRRRCRPAGSRARARSGTRRGRSGR